MKKLLPLAAAAVLASLVVATGVGAASATAFTVNSDFPFDAVINVPCANGGAGEDVHFTGTIHDVLHVTLTGNGGVNIKTHDNPQGVTGIGLTTGDKYQGTGVTQDQTSSHVGAQESFINNFRLIGQGSGNNSTLHENFHVTVNANGDITVVHDNVTADCK